MQASKTTIRIDPLKISLSNLFILPMSILKPIMKRRKSIPKVANN